MPNTADPREAEVRSVIRQRSGQLSDPEGKRHQEILASIPKVTGRGAHRRQFTPEQKLALLDEHDATVKGQKPLTPFYKRFQIKTTAITNWRAEQASGLLPRSRPRPTRNPIPMAPATREGRTFAVIPPEAPKPASETLESLFGAVFTRNQILKEAVDKIHTALQETSK